MLRAVIVEDEPLARRYLCGPLEATGSVLVVGEAGQARTGLDLIEAARPDAVFLDIGMPGTDGITLAKRLLALAPAPVPLVVFVTGHADRALDAFQVEAVDYLLKPIEAASVARGVSRLQRRLAERGSENTPASPPISALELGAGGILPAGDRLPVKTGALGDVTRLLAPGDIVAALRRDRRTFVHTAAREFATYHPVGALETWLAEQSARGNAPPFVLLARDALVNLHAVSEIVHYGDRLYQVRLRDRADTVVEASRSGAARLAAYLKPPV